MFQDLLKRLIQPNPAPIADADARLALTALLVRVARSDNDYSSDEQQLIDQITQDRYGLSLADAQALRTEGEAMEAAAPDTVRFTRAIKDSVAYEDRLAVIKALWKVVLADGKRAKEEDALLRLVTNLLGVSDPDSARARQQVS
ncbi:TerB family tellurite resistance protein [Tateyamaria sp.]|uniref:tellurite resistance TerB family protein n=1 Tax=Tateyamaria sp. TaxID=1929288 RepID=UPI00329A94E5